MSLQMATELLTKAVQSDSVLHVTYSLAGMAVTVGETEWRADGGTRSEVEMEEAIRNLQDNGLVERKAFGRPITQTLMRPTARAYREFSDD